MCGAGGESQRRDAAEIQKAKSMCCTIVGFRDKGRTSHSIAPGGARAAYAVSVVKMTGVLNNYTTPEGCGRGL